MRKGDRTESTAERQAGPGVGRRNLLKLTGAGVAALGLTSLLKIPFAKAQDMSNGADNFYTSDKVTVQKVTFKNQYQMNVAGNLFIPNSLNRNTRRSGDRRRASDGRGEGAKRESVCHENG